VAEEVVLAADLLVEDLAAEAAFGGGFGGGGFSGGGSEVGTDSVNIVSQKKLQIAAFFCDYLCVITCEKH
jgi:uncharacterized membrane protein